MTILNTATLVRRVDSQVELLSPSVNTVLILPSTPNMLGKVFTFVNSGTANVLVQAADASLVRTVYPGTTGQVTPNTDSASTASQWEGVGMVVSNTFSIPSPNSIYTLVDNNNANTAITNCSVTQAFASRSGDKISVRVLLAFTGTPTNVVFNLKIASTYLVDYTKYFAVSGGLLTLFGRAGSYNRNREAFVFNNSQSPTGMIFQDTSTNALWQGSTPAWASGDYVVVELDYPVTGWTATKG